MILITAGSSCVSPRAMPSKIACVDKAIRSTKEARLQVHEHLEGKGSEYYETVLVLKD